MGQLLSAYIAAQQPKPPEKKELDLGALISVAIAISPILFSRTKDNTPAQNSGVSVQVNNYNQNTNTVVNNEVSWIKRIVKQPFRMITGGQGSGKSTQERYWINLLKTDGWHIICLNPNTTPDSWKGVQMIDKPQEIDNFLKEFPNWVESRREEARREKVDEDRYLDFISQRRGKKGKVAIFFQEANNFELRGVDPSIWKEALTVCLTDIRKWGFTACLSCQADSVKTIASKLMGYAKRLEASPTIECMGLDEESNKYVGLLKLPGRKVEKVLLPHYPDSKDFTTREANGTLESDIQANNGDNSTNNNSGDPVISVGDDSRKNSSTKQLSRRELLADKICKSLAGKGRVKVSSLARSCNALRTYLENKFESSSFDNDELVREVHIILEILVMKERGVIYGERDKSGLIIPTKNNDFEVLKYGKENI